MVICLRRPVGKHDTKNKRTAIINMSELDITKVRRWCRVEWAGRGVVRGRTCSTARRPADLQPLTALSVPGDSGRRAAHPHTRALSHLPFVSRQLVTSDLFQTVA